MLTYIYKQERKLYDNTTYISIYMHTYICVYLNVNRKTFSIIRVKKAGKKQNKRKQNKIYSLKRNETREVI